MKITRIQIKNFRSLNDININVGDLNTILGANGVGKSNILTALNVFFRNKVSSISNDFALKEDDFFLKDTTTPIEITITFEDLSVQAQEDFKAYFRDGKLIISAKATWQQELSAAPVEFFGRRNVIKEFSKFFALLEEKAPVRDLKEEYQLLQKTYTTLPVVSTKTDMEEALRSFEEKSPALCTQVESKDQFYGFTKGDNLLGKYIQWVYIPAVKEASSEQDEGKGTALGSLLQRTIRNTVSFEEEINKLKEDFSRQYTDIVSAKDALLNTVEESLKNKLQEWVNPNIGLNLKWFCDPSKAVSVDEPFARVSIAENGFLSEINKVGHGLQRAFILSLLQQMSSSDGGNAPKLILAIEEPELYQHPPQARHFSTVLENLSNNNSQIFITTHSPYFIPRKQKSYESIKRVCLDVKSKSSIIQEISLESITKTLEDALTCQQIPTTELMAKINSIMSPEQNEIFFSSVPVLTEGLEDVAFISTYLELSDQWNLFRQYGCHFIKIGGKTNMSRPIAIAKELKIPVFSIFDSDITEECGAEDTKNIKDNTCLLNLYNVKLPDNFYQSTFTESTIMLAPHMTAVITNDLGIENWRKETSELSKIMPGVTMKNADHIILILERLWAKGIKSEILLSICSRILEFGKKANQI